MLEKLRGIFVSLSNNLILPKRKTFWCRYFEMFFILPLGNLAPISSMKCQPQKNHHNAACISVITCTQLWRVPFWRVLLYPLWQMPGWMSRSSFQCERSSFPSAKHIYVKGLGRESKAPRGQPKAEWRVLKRFLNTAALWRKVQCCLWGKKLSLGRDQKY